MKKEALIMRSIIRVMQSARHGFKMKNLLKRSLMQLQKAIRQEWHSGNSVWKKKVSGIQLQNICQAINSGLLTVTDISYSSHLNISYIHKTCQHLQCS